MALRPCRLRAAAAVVALLVLAAAPVGAIEVYAKEFYVTGVAAGATIDAGMVVQTWGSAGGTGVSTHLIVDAPVGKPDQKVEMMYPHASTSILRKRNGGKVVNGVEQGFPIAPTGKIVDANGGVGGGYDSGTVGIQDDHTAANSADARVKIDQRVAGPLPNTLKVRNAGGGTDLLVVRDTVHAAMIGKSDAGKPDANDRDKLHSADSFAAAEVKGGRTFVGGAGRPAYTEVVGRMVMSGGAIQAAFDRQTFELSDPYFVDLVDLDLDAVTREQVMTLRVGGSNALYSIDDAGIRLTIARGDPHSSVSIAFSSTASPWVLNPYGYGAVLDAGGLSASGVTPRDAWTLTTTADRVEAWYAFGPGGQPFDYAQVSAPASLFAADRMYRYDAGAGVGAVALAAVPEPATTLLFAAGCAVVFGRRRRR